MPWGGKENGICEDATLRASGEGRSSCLLKFFILEGIKEHYKFFKTALLCRARTENSTGFPRDPSVLLQPSGAFNQKHKQLPHTQTWSVSLVGQGIHSSCLSTSLKLLHHYFQLSVREEVSYHELGLGHLQTVISVVECCGQVAAWT